MDRRKNDAKGGKTSSGKQKSLLHDLNEKKVMLITFDGRLVIGTMRGFDQVCNIVLEKSVERVFAVGQPPKEVQLGLFVARGDNVAVVGQVDDEKDAASNWQNSKVWIFDFNCVRPVTDMVF